MSSIVSDSRLPHIKGSIFATMARAAKKYGAVNLSQGFPDFAPDQRLLDALSEAVQGNHNQYGLPECPRRLNFEPPRRLNSEPGWRPV